MFDALQAALIEETGYRNKQFAVIHPAGAVGQLLMLKIAAPHVNTYDTAISVFAEQNKCNANILFITHLITEI